MAEQSLSSVELVGLAGRAQARSMGSPRPGASQAITTGTGAAVSNASKFPVAAHLTLVATGNPCFVRTSVDGLDAAVVDTDFFLPVNVPTTIQLGYTDNVAHRFVSAISITGAGKLNISVMDAVPL